MKENNSYRFLFCIGVQKSGTSYLYQLMKQHKSVTFSEFKETHFFSNRNSGRSTDYYLKQFRIGHDTRYIADFTPDYINRPEVLERISGEFGEDTRIIVLMRDPVKRAFSNYLMAFSRGRERRNFDTVAKDKDSMIIKRGLYADLLDNVFEYFTRSQVLLLVFEEFIKNPQKTMDQVAEFLCIEKIAYELDCKINSAKQFYHGIWGTIYFKIPISVRRTIQNKIQWLGKLIFRILHSNARTYKETPVLGEKERNELALFYKDSNERLAEKYGVDISEWL